MSTIQEINSARTGDKYYKINHDSGLTIYVYPKDGYTSSYGIFGTNYGSINTRFSVDGGQEITVPDGIAHYLEHKLFESEDGDAFSKYAIASSKFLSAIKAVPAKKYNLKSSGAKTIAFLANSTAFSSCLFFI